MATKKKAAAKPARTKQKAPPVSKSPVPPEEAVTPGAVINPGVTEQQPPAPTEDTIPAVTTNAGGEGLTDDAKQHPGASRSEMPPADHATIIPEQITDPLTEEEEPEIINDPEEEIIEQKAKFAATRNPLTGLFTLEEREYIEEHLALRIEKGLTKNANHFVRQCVNFCVNFTPGWEFGRAKVPRKHFE